MSDQIITHCENDYGKSLPDFSLGIGTRVKPLKPAAVIDTAIPQHVRTEMKATPQGVSVRVFFRWLGRDLYLDCHRIHRELSLLPDQHDGQPAAPDSVDTDERSHEHTNGNAHAQPDTHEHADAD